MKGGRSAKHLRRTFSTYFAWAKNIVATTRVGHILTTPLGWRLHPRPYADSSRTRVNFLIQATGADILRTACLLANDRGLEIIATVHDSIIIQAPDEMIEEHSRILHEVMKEAAVIILGKAGSIMRVEMEVIHSGHSFKLDETDARKFQDVLGWLSTIKQSPSVIA
jgi:DNA polymerase I-like protein with 3'-5' exonuclease and polymerase domains